MPRFNDYMPAGVIPATLLAYDDDFAIDEDATRDHVRDDVSVAYVDRICKRLCGDQQHL